MYYNFCENTKYSCDGASALMIADYGNNTCLKLAGPAKNTNAWSFEGKSCFLYIDDSSDKKNSSKILIIGLNHGQVCKKNTNLNYTIKMRLKCDNFGENRKITWNEDSFSKFDPEDCASTIEATSKEGITILNY